MENFDLYKLDGHTLRVFAMVLETGSVTRAAEKCQLSQSTVSHCLDKMRAALGDPLFMKSGRRIMPTEMALTVQPRVRHILASLESLVDSDAYDPARDTRPMAVGIPSPSLLTEMQTVSRRLGEEAPDVLLKIVRLAPRSMLLEMLEDGRADVAISVAADSYPSVLTHLPYASEDMMVFYDPNVRPPVKTIEDYFAARHGVVDFGGSSESMVDLGIRDIGLERRVSVVAPTASTLADLIEGTDVICTMPVGLSRAAYSKLGYTKPPFDLPPLRYDMVWHKRFDQSGRNQWLRRLLLDARVNRSPMSGNGADGPA